MINTEWDYTASNKHKPQKVASHCATGRPVVAAMIIGTVNLSYRTAAARPILRAQEASAYLKKKKREMRVSWRTTSGGNAAQTHLISTPKYLTRCHLAAFPGDSPLRLRTSATRVRVHTAGDASCETPWRRYLTNMRVHRCTWWNINRGLALDRSDKLPPRLVPFFFIDTANSANFLTPLSAMRISRRGKVSSVP